MNLLWLSEAITCTDLSEERCISMRWTLDRYLWYCCSKPTRGEENRRRRIRSFPYLITYARLVRQMLFANDRGLCWQSTVDSLLLTDLPIYHFPPPPAWYWILLAGNVFIFQTHSWICEKWLLDSSCSSLRPSLCPHETRRLPLDGFSWNAIFEGFFPKIFRENSSLVKIWQE